MEQSASPVGILPTLLPMSTPETNRVTLYAGFWRRVVARIIDGIVLGSVFSLLALLLGLGAVARFIAFPFHRHWQTPDIAFAAPFILSLIALVFLAVIGQWLYYALMESSPNQGTIGKMAIGIKVTDTFGNRLSFGRATARHFGKIVSGSMLGVGYIIAAFTERKQALHDMIASTLVVMK